MDVEAIKAEFLRLNTREVAHQAALQLLFSEATPTVRDRLRRMASTYGDLSLATSIPDEWRAEFEETLLLLLGEPEGTGGYLPR